MTTTIGTSSYGDLKGVAQVLSDEAGRQFIGCLNETNAALGYTKTSGARITPNEGFRGKARQSALLNARILYVAGRGPFAALAASPLYSSIHGPGGDVTKSRAVDLGVTLPDGSNRALNAAEQAAWRAHEWAYGIESTGDTFASVEPWHKEYGHHAPTKITPVGIKVATLKTSASSTPAAPAIHYPGDAPNMIAVTTSTASTKATSLGVPKGAKFIFDMEAKTIERVDTSPDTAAARLIRRRVYEALAAMQPKAKALAWNGDTVREYVRDGGFTRVKW